jgi:iron complex outermembrane receptor protein
MKGRSFSKAALLLSTAFTSLAFAGAALAQPASGGDSNKIEEVVVTATRQSQNINVVPLAVTAETQKNLDQQGVQTIGDLQGIVPGFRITDQEGSGNVKVAIRGIVQNIGAATTGFYLDETPLQKRDASGFLSQNGTPVPPLFDLDRVEVLRGPQGTLFGGGSEGGTVRYIQAQPSLTHYSEYARAQYSGNAYGDPSYEAGAAVGGPIVQDKLGFRASIFARQTGGFIDLTNFQTGQVYQKNSNSGDLGSARLAVTWAPTNYATITASYFGSTNETKNNDTSFTLPVTGTLSVPTSCFNPASTAAFPLVGVLALARSNPSPFATGVICQGMAGAPGVYVRPGYTLGPLNLSPYQEVAIGPTPTSTQMQVASIDAKFDLPHDQTFRSITSYVHDRQTGSQAQTFPLSTMSYSPAVPALAALYAAYPTYTLPGQAPLKLTSGIQFNPDVTASVNQYPGNFLVANAHNEHTNFTQEFRLSSSPNQTPVSYVIGAYFSNARLVVHQLATWNDVGYQQLDGANAMQQFGTPDPGYFANINEIDQDTETALFGEATWHANDKLNLLAGLRVTHLVSTFSQSNAGPNSFNLTPSVAAGTQVLGSITNDPVTPKFSAEYTFAPHELVYATASEGYRAGGINQVITSTGQILLNVLYGLSDTSRIPKFYQQDTVWSYEVGGKFGFLDGRGQINVAAYLIDWDNVQVNQSIGGDAFVVNAPHAESKGVEVETQFRPISGLSLNAAVSYDQAQYTSNYNIDTGNPANPIKVVQNGQLFPQPQWTADLGARYDLRFSDAYRGYFRADYRWASGFQTVPPGNPSYSPDSSNIPETRNLDLRIGLEHDSYELNIFATNLTDNREGPTTGGRSQCFDTACTSYNSYTVYRTTNWGVPRTIGVQFVYRH